MLKIKKIINIIKMLKIGIGVKTIEEVEYALKDFYTVNGIIENKHRKCNTCKHHHKMSCPNSSDCYSIDYKPFYEKVESEE